MQCPYCHEEMQEGQIKTKGEVIKWIPKEKHAQLLETRWAVKKGEIKLGTYSYFVGGSVKAYCCTKCQKVIVDYKE